MKSEKSSRQNGINISAQNVKDAFEFVAGNYKAKKLGINISHAESINDAEYVITRDTLVQLGVRFMQAEKLSRDHTGHAWARIQRCLEHL